MGTRGIGLGFDMVDGGGGGADVVDTGFYINLWRKYDRNVSIYEQGNNYGDTTGPFYAWRARMTCSDSISDLKSRFFALLAFTMINAHS